MDITLYLERFEQAWQSGERPDLREFFLAQASACVDEAQRRALLIDLIAIDLERRWRHSGEAITVPGREVGAESSQTWMRLEDYVRRFPNLLAEGEMPLALICQEYRVRRRWGDRPDHTEYLARYASLGDELVGALREIDIELGEEVPGNHMARVYSLDLTENFSGHRIPPEEAEQPAIPERIGRYRIERVLGKGGFGLVYLAHDEQLSRRVAMKVPHARLVSRSEEAELYLAEARTVANLDHPHIVPVYDIGGTAEFPCYVVSKYIEGTDLTSRLRASRLGHVQAADLITTIAEALHYAHTQGLVHRDVKPGNILIGGDGRPYLVDFGLALREQDFGRGAKYAGTPAYMSPEQARGEGHRVDGRSDIFSLGVVFYELLVQRRPFAAPSQSELLDQITTLEARPPRQIDDKVPKELERICLKALSKRAADRYTTAKDLADDLRHFLSEVPAHQRLQSEVSNLNSQISPGGPASETIVPGDTPPATPDSDSRPARIVPKGLRSFDRHDADFFLELLPGPRDRDGLPDSLRFWKTRIEETDPDHTFSVGLIYGPSGCGKSSLVKAGLMPRLSPKVNAVYVEATADETETRLLYGLRKACPALSDRLDLPASLAALRRDQSLPASNPMHRRVPKVLIVLDQFEQWLHAKKEESNTELVQALRQCDGAHVQCIVMVRDDFWLAVSRFLRDLEVRLVEGENSALADLFDADHAGKVLAAFGRAFGKLPETSGDKSPEQKDFLIQAVSGLTQEGKVICVRLALFAEMMKGKSWTPATLKEVGGTQGVGVTFLEETFSAATAPPEHRYHQKAARSVLAALLPELGTDIKGHMRSHQELLAASGYGNRPRDFDDLVRILDGEIRLITPTDPEGKEETMDEGGRRKDESDSSFHPPPSSFRYYQLTHDYLVPSLRDWLTRKQKETRRGRAELRLAERSATWNAKPERRYLPSLWETLSIVGLTPRKNWTLPQRKMMRAAGMLHGVWAAGISLLLVIASVSGLTIRHNILAERERVQGENLEQQNLTRAEGLVDALVNADTAQVPEIVKQLGEYSRLADPLLAEKLAQAKEGSTEKLHLSLALAGKDDEQVEYLYEQLLRAEPSRFPVIRDTLAKYQDRLQARLWIVLKSPDKDPRQQRLRAAGALAKYDPQNAHWNEVAPELAAQIVAISPVFLHDWMVALRPVRDRLLAPLGEIYRDPKRRESERSLATELLAEYAADQPAALVDLVQDADEAQFAVMFPRLQEHGAAALKLLEAEVVKTATPDWQDSPLPADGRPVEAALVHQIEGADGLVAERFAFCQTLPLDRFVAVSQALKTSGYRPTRFRPYDIPLAPRTGDGAAPAGQAKSGPRAAPTTLVAAVWTRDGRDFLLSHDATPSEVQDRDAQVRQEGFLPADAAGYVTASPEGTPLERYAALWVKRASDTDEARLFVGVDSPFTDENKKLRSEGQHFATLQHFVSPEGRYRYCLIQRRQAVGTDAGWGQDEGDYLKQVLLRQLHHDVSLTGVKPASSAHDHYTQMLTQAEQALTTKVADPAALRQRALARSGLHQDPEAVEELTAVLTANPKDSEAYKWRALSHARQGNKEVAAADLAEYAKLATHPSQAASWDAVVAAWQGDATGLERLQAAMATQEQDSLWLYNAACAYALAAQAFAKDADRSATYTAQAAKLLTRAVAAGYANLAAIRDDLDLESIRERAEFREVLANGHLDRSYSSIYQASPAFESVELFGQSPSDHLASCRELQSQGFRPAALSTVNLHSVASGQRSVASSVWHRPMVPSDSRLAHARRQASAAIALLRQGERDKMFSALRITDDPESLTQFVHRSRARGVSVAELWECVQLAERNRQALQGKFRRMEDRVLFGLLLALGEFSWDELPEAFREPAVAQVAKWYREDPSSAIHGASGWLLRQWGQVDVARQVDQTPVHYDSQREWFTLAVPAGEKKFFQTYIVFPAGEYEIGSPGDERDRSKDETRHVVRLSRPLAILDREITRAEFEASGITKINVEEISPTPQHVICATSWYDSVRYCRWLTTRAGLPEEEQCYADPQSLDRQKYPADPVESAAGAPRNWPVHLERRGFRLPTEAEWEIAARGGMRSKYGFGGDVSLLDRYGWFQVNSGKRTHVPRELRPNVLGLFDLHGNVYEWCQDWYGNYALEGSRSDPIGLLTGSNRVYRGGGWSSDAANCRLAVRFTIAPTGRSLSDGFRLALSPSGVTPEAEKDK